jgi:DNA polymerase-3 subunit delta'
MSEIQQPFPWLQDSWLQLNRYIDQQRIPQALLITGAQGIGKQQLASYFTQSILCNAPLANNTYCGKCQSCLLFKAQTHPDYYSIEPEEKGRAIGISVIRQLTSTLSLKPQYDSYRVVIINPADRLNNASSNAFLKYLEEPTERTCLILLSDQPSHLPATIRSRCQKLFIPCVSNINDLDSWWGDNGITENQALLFSLSQGSPLLAKQLSDTELLKNRKKYVNDWLMLSSSRDNFIDIAEQWSKLGAEEIKLLIVWVISWVIDMIKLKNTHRDIRLHNVDLADNLKDMAIKLDLKDMYRYYDFLLSSQKRLETQLNKQLIFEEVLIRWLQINGR